MLLDGRQSVAYLSTNRGGNRGDKNRESMTMDNENTLDCWEPLTDVQYAEWLEIRAAELGVDLGNELGQ